MKDNQYVMYLWHETEMRRKEKDDRKKRKQNPKSDVDNDVKKEKDQHLKSHVDNDVKKEKDQHNFVEKTILDKEQEKEIHEMKAAKPEAYTFNIDNNARIDVSYGPKSVHERVEEDVGSSSQPNDVVPSSSLEKQQNLANEDVGTSDQQNDIPQA